MNHSESPSISKEKNSDKMHAEILKIRGLSCDRTWIISVPEKYPELVLHNESSYNITEKKYLRPATLDDGILFSLGQEG